MFIKPATPCPKCAGERYRCKNGDMYCKQCAAMKYKNRTPQERSRHRASGRASYYKNKDTFKRYYANNKEKILKYHKKYNKEIRHPDYQVWAGIVQRCTNPKNKDFKRYGARGITICDEWRKSFNTFIRDMGDRPQPRGLYSIERRDVNGNYEPGNCCWIKNSEQAKNRRNSIDNLNNVDETTSVWYNGRELSLSQLSYDSGVHIKALLYRASKSLDSDWIFSNHPTRKYTLRGIKYSLKELSIMLDFNMSTLYEKLNSRINRINLDELN